ncbi:ABC transporter ATP-binding protein [Desulfonatronum sp. SC1]|uniref:ABC transporter ATP-binding protein n=1 Tax=Desulfonatronum sp. SC1 TaxID=2109626 RepID=UPI000D2F5039|nr:ABC transporter ATP-binding protein [Desulfonatronum sp. SC1]PTN38462.1 ABC transporter ATP-binding protein [Desulfonatronum sp. SC1]
MRIELNQVSKVFKNAVALDDISFTVESGELVVILGPSGCGKSTLLRIVAGLDDASFGTVRVGGQDVTKLSPDRRGISMVFQSYALFPHLNVAENIVFGLRIRGLGKAEIRKRLDHAAGMLGLGELLDRKPAQLSGGQRQRVALGRAIVSQQPICLMDEPLSNLDAKLRHEMRREILELQRKLRMTMVYVTHDQVEAMTMADRIVLLDHGRVAQISSPAELYARPSSLFAAQFIGSPPMNMLALEPFGEGCALAGSERLIVRGGCEPLLLGVRPEDVRPAEGGIPGVVIRTEYHGADTLVAAQVSGQEVVMRLYGKHDYQAGDAIHMIWDRESSHLFSVESGERREGLEPRLVLPETAR